MVDKRKRGCMIISMKDVWKAMNYKGIIFDLDGVLCFTDQYHYLAWKELADKEGIYFDEKINNRLRGVSRMESLNIILERANKTYTDDEKMKMAEYKNTIYKKLLSNMTPHDIAPDVLQTLHEIKSNGIKIAIGSSSKNTKSILNYLGILELFDAISDGTNITKSKPDPEVFLKAAKMLNFKPNECLVVEDAFSGVEAAVNGGFDVVGMGDARKDKRATYIIHSFVEIKKYI